MATRVKRFAGVVLCVYALVFAISAGATRGSSGVLGLLAQYALAFVVCAWVLADARERRRRVCYDFDSFLFFAWPIVAPIYLFQTRGVRAFVPIVLFGVVLMAAYVGAFLLARL